jgi:two-component system chemotaxis response regulator CheY
MRQGHGERTTALVVDDFASIRALLTVILERRYDCEVVAQAGNAECARVSFLQCCPDLVTLDLNLEDNEGLEVLDDLMLINPEARVVIITAENDPDLLRAVLAKGATAVVSKPIQFTYLDAAMQRAMTES